MATSTPRVAGYRLKLYCYLQPFACMHRCDLAMVIGAHLTYEPYACSCLRPGTKMRRRVDAVLSLDLKAEQLPALSTILVGSEPEFQAMLQKVLSGKFRKQIRPLKNPDRALRVRHPGLWRQL